MTVSRPPHENRERGGRTGAVFWSLLPLPGLAWAVQRAVGREVDILVQLSVFTPQAALGSVLPLGLALARRRWLPAALAALATTLLVGSVAPRALGNGDRGPRTGVSLPVMTANMLAGGADPAAIVRLVRANEVGVLALQEFTGAARAALSAAGLDTLLPYTSLAPPRSADPLDTTGSALYSRFPISAAGFRLNQGGFQQAYGTVQPPGAGALLVESAHALAPVRPRQGRGLEGGSREPARARPGRHTANPAGRLQLDP